MTEELRLALTVEKSVEALAFYRDTLGLEPLEMWIAEGSKGALLDAGRATLELRVAGPIATPWHDVNVRLNAPAGMQLTLFTRA